MADEEIFERERRGKKISQLPTAAALTGTELVESVQSGNNVQTTTQAIANLVGGADPGVAGQVLTSNGVGVAPTFQAGGGGGSLFGCFSIFVNYDGTILTSSGINAVTKVGLGAYNVDLTSCGFQAEPQCIAALDPGEGLQQGLAQCVVVSMTEVDVQTTNGSGDAGDLTFTLFANGRIALII
jgi:hypothetical protein